MSTVSTSGKNRDQNSKSYIYKIINNVESPGNINFNLMIKKKKIKQDKSGLLISKLLALIKRNPSFKNKIKRSIEAMITPIAEENDKFWSKLLDNMTLNFALRKFDVSKVTETKDNRNILNEVSMINAKETKEIEHLKKMIEGKKGDDYFFEDRNYVDISAFLMKPLDPVDYYKDLSQEDYITLMKKSVEINPKLALRLFAVIACSYKYCHLNLNIQVLDIVNKLNLPIIVSYYIRQMMFILYKEETIYKSKGNINNRHVISQDVGAKLTMILAGPIGDIFPGSKTTFGQKLAKIDDIPSYSVGRGVYSSVDFKIRLDMFTNYILDVLDDIKLDQGIKLYMTGSIMTACGLKTPRLINEEEYKRSEINRGDEIDWFRDKYGNSDIDIAIYLPNQVFKPKEEKKGKDSNRSKDSDKSKEEKTISTSEQAKKINLAAKMRRETRAGSESKEEKEEKEINLDLKKVVDQIFKRYQDRYPIAKLETVVTNKYRIKIGDRKIELFQIFYDNPAGIVYRFHVGCVRSYYDIAKKSIHCLPSYIWAGMTGTNIDLRYFRSENTQMGIVYKNMTRGFYTLLNKTEQLALNAYLTEKKLPLDQGNQDYSPNNRRCTIPISPNRAEVLIFTYRSRNTRQMIPKIPNAGTWRDRGMETVNFIVKNIQNQSLDVFRIESDLCIEISTFWNKLLNCIRIPSYPKVLKTKFNPEFPLYQNPIPSTIYASDQLTSYSPVKKTKKKDGKSRGNEDEDGDEDKPSDKEKSPKDDYNDIFPDKSKISFPSDIDYEPRKSRSPQLDESEELERVARDLNSSRYISPNKSFDSGIKKSYNDMTEEGKDDFEDEMMKLNKEFRTYEDKKDEVDRLLSTGNPLTAAELEFIDKFKSSFEAKKPVSPKTKSPKTSMESFIDSMTSDKEVASRHEMKRLFKKFDTSDSRESEADRLVASGNPLTDTEEKFIDFVETIREARNKKNQKKPASPKTKNPKVETKSPIRSTKSFDDMSEKELEDYQFIHRDDISEFHKKYKSSIDQDDEANRLLSKDSPLKFDERQFMDIYAFTKRLEKDVRRKPRSPKKPASPKTKSPKVETKSPIRSTKEFDDMTEEEKDAFQAEMLRLTKEFKTYETKEKEVNRLLAMDKPLTATEKQFIDIFKFTQQLRSKKK